MDYTVEQIRAAFVKTFHDSREIWFGGDKDIKPHLGRGEADAGTEASWQEFVLALTGDPAQR